MSKLELLIRHTPCMVHGVLFCVGQRAFMVTQRIDINLAMELVDDFAMVIIALF
jgi:hypothetical protein